MSLKGVAVGAGYFSQFHYDAWSRIEGVQLAAVCDLDRSRAQAVCQQFGVERAYTQIEEMLVTEQPDFIDIITPPDSHEAVCKLAGEAGVDVICQKPLAPEYATARRIVENAAQAGIRFMVHENFRFQPWHREMRRLMDSGALGDTLHALRFRTRTGDGWGDNAYLERQPYFQEYPRLLIYETGIHFIDTFRFLGGEVKSVFCHLARLNPVIAGEDAGLLLLEFENGANALWDANRFNEPNFDNPRYTFGEFLVEGDGGSLRVYPDGRMTVQPLGGVECDHAYEHHDHGFGGDCCYFTQQHFIDGLLNDKPFETDGNSYLESLRVQEAAYASASTHSVVKMSEFKG